MGLKIFNTKLSELSKTSILVVSNRIKFYWERMEIKSNNKPLNYFLSFDNNFSVGQLLTEEYLEKSEINYIPIIDQSKNYIVGYTDREDLIYKGNLPVIVFGDHTRTFKFIDFPFVQGADGIKILFPDKNKIMPLFFYYLLKCVSVPSRGYNRHFSILSLQRYQLFTIEEQKDILAQIAPLETQISTLKASKLKPLHIINQAFADIFGFDSNYYQTFGKGMTAGTQQSDNKEKVIYTIPFSYLAKSTITRISGRFHNPKTQFLTEKLHSKPTIKLKDILVEKAHRGTSPQYDTEGEIAVVKTAHLKNGYLEISEDEFVDENFYNKNLRSQIFQNDVLIASTGKVSLGKVDIVEIDRPLVVDGHITILRINQELYNPFFLTYFLRSILGTFQIERDFTGSTNQIELYTSEIENFDIPNFTLEQQNEIVTTIKQQLNAQNGIDQQIVELQNQINAIIENAITQE